MWNRDGNRWDDAIPIGSIVYIIIDNGDAGIGVVLGKTKYDTYRVYRLPPDDDMVTVLPHECFVDWKPEEM